MKVYNTLSATREDFRPAGNEVKMYVCGVTPYSDAHIGHAMSYIIFDVIRRYLRFCGYRVKYVQNVTDIDDKIIKRANESGTSTSELAEHFSQRYFEDMASLNVTPADIYPRATQEIPKIIEVIASLTEKGFAYPAAGSVYFRVRRDTDYGKLSHRTVDDMRSGARVEADEDKEDPLDFVLWKGAKPGEPSWESPWGPGRPGWHIECSAMSLKYLGETIDIHGGGEDLIFPHHENEIAQSESFSGVKPFVRYWLHNGHLRLGEEKMSKSLGNLISIRDMVSRYGADAMRVFVLSSHYRSPLTYSEEILEASARGMERLLQAAATPGDPANTAAALETDTYRQAFIEAMDDDFNTPQALAVLFNLARDINRAETEGNATSAARQLLRELGGNILGLSFQTKTTALDDAGINKLAKSIGEAIGVDTREIPHDAAAAIEWLIQLRQQLREQKRYREADTVRQNLAAGGITLEDRPGATTWKQTG